MNIALTIISVLLMLTALVATVRPRIWAPAAAYAALGLMSLAPEAAVSSPTLIFWGIATLIACGISYMLPSEVSRSSLGMPYITIASVAGTLIGMILSQAGMIVGAAAGALCGAVAYAQTPRGKVLDCPSARFFNYACAKGLPATVTSCMCGLAVIAILTLFGK